VTCALVCFIVDIVLFVLSCVVVDFEDLCEHLFGRAGYLLNLFTIFSLDYGSCVAYLIIIGDTVTSVVSVYTTQYVSSISQFLNCLFIFL
jgi:amino acid permease